MSLGPRVPPPMPSIPPPDPMALELPSLADLVALLERILSQNRTIIELLWEIRDHA